MVFQSKLAACPICGAKPVKMEFIFPKDKKRREYSFICCDLNPGHSNTLEEAADAWNELISELIVRVSAIKKGGLD